MYSVSSRLFIFYFFGFHLFSLKSFPAITSSQRKHGPCVGSHLPGHLCLHCSLLSRSITLRPGEQVKCLPACCLSTSSAPSFLFGPPFQDFPQSAAGLVLHGTRPRLWYGPLHVTAQKGASLSDMEGGGTCHSHSGQQLCHMASKTGQVSSCI